MEPSLGADRLASAPWKEPMGVRAPLRITVCRITVIIAHRKMWRHIPHVLQSRPMGPIRAVVLGLCGVACATSSRVPRPRAKRPDEGAALVVTALHRSGLRF